MTTTRRNLLGVSATALLALSCTGALLFAPFSLGLAACFLGAIALYVSLSMVLGLRQHHTFLVLLNLAIPAAFAVLLHPIVQGRAWVCNGPAVVARGLVAGAFLIGAALLVQGNYNPGRVLSGVAVFSNLLVVGWIWIHSGLLLTIEMIGWLIVDGLITGLLIYSMIRSHGQQDERAA